MICVSGFYSEPQNMYCFAVKGHWTSVTSSPNLIKSWHFYTNRSVWLGIAKLYVLDLLNFEEM